MTADRVYVVDRHGVHVFDADSGDSTWRSRGSAGLEPSAAPAPESVHAVGRRCRAQALDAGGVRWTREPSVGDCVSVGGWLDGEAVAFLFESGDFRWLQRTGQDPGLL